MKLSSALASLAADPEHPVDLARVALLIARDAYPRLNPWLYLDQLEQLANQVRYRLTGSLEARTAELSSFLFDECGFAGNTKHYYDPRNSYLNKVLDRQVGLPISLSLVTVAVGTRAGLPVVGVALPGHFVVKTIESNGDQVVFDPFNGGQFLDTDGCEALVTAITGQPFDVTPEALAATPPGAFIQRILNNLKTAYLADRSYRRAARIARRLTQLLPNDPTQQRDYGLLLVQANHFGPAINPIRRYLAARPQAEDTEEVRRILKRALAEVGRWN
jgi:regulator of sirC expression with transglutaminase-like and TPR domain